MSTPHVAWENQDNQGTETQQPTSDFSTDSSNRQGQQYSGQPFSAGPDQAADAPQAASDNSANDIVRGVEAMNLDDTNSPAGTGSHYNIPTPSESRNPRRSAPFPPKYSGTRSVAEINAWIDAVDDFFSLDHTLDSERVLWAGSFLDGSARKWYRQWRSAAATAALQAGNASATRVGSEVSIRTAVQPTWELLRNELKAMFAPPDHEQRCFAALQEIRQRGSVSEYTDRFIDTILEFPAELKATQASLFLSNYIRGLKYYIQKEVRLRSPATFEVAQQYAYTVEEASRSMESSPPSRPQNLNRSNPSGFRGGPRTSMDKSMTPSSAAKQSSQFSQPWGRLSSAERERRREKGLCVYCGSAEHAVDACPQRKIKNVPTRM